MHTIDLHGQNQYIIRESRVISQVFFFSSKLNTSLLIRQDWWLNIVWSQVRWIVSIVDVYGAILTWQLGEWAHESFFITSWAKPRRARFMWRTGWAGPGQTNLLVVKTVLVTATDIIVPSRLTHTNIVASTLKNETSNRCRPSHRGLPWPTSSMVTVEICSRKRSPVSCLSLLASFSPPLLYWVMN